eukprot:3505765-Rhodomonas_salina.2
MVAAKAEIAEKAEPNLRGIDRAGSQFVSCSHAHAEVRVQGLGFGVESGLMVHGLESRQARSRV